VAAGAMLVLNVLWIIFEREKPPAGGPNHLHGGAQEPLAGQIEPGPERPGPGTPPKRRKPRIL